MNKDSKIFIVGHGDVIDRSLIQYFQANGYAHVFSNVDLGINTAVQPSVYEFFQNERPEYVFLASTRSGGIQANLDNPGEFIYHNLESQNNVVYAAHKFGARKLMFFGSSCVYPKACSQPMKEDQLWTGKVEESSEAYAVAKLAGIKLVQAYKKQYGFNAIAVIPATVYGAQSDTDIKTAHVIGALIGKFSEAVAKGESQVTVWGSGQPKREFLYADDFVEACLFLMDNYDGDGVVNVGYGTDISIKDLAELIAGQSGFTGKIIFDDTKPDGAMRKLLDTSTLNSLGWQPKISLKEGIARIIGDSALFLNRKK